MKSKLLILFTFFALTPVTNLFAESPYTVLPCNIEFPKSVKKIPQICIYQGGERFTCEIDNEGHRACFILPIDKACDTFYLVITEALAFETEGNTVQYLKVMPECQYKFYEMKLVRTPKKKYKVPSERVPVSARRSSPGERRRATSGAGEKDEPAKKDKWIVVVKELPENKQIPDDAIIVLLDAQYVDDVKPENNFEFPKIVIKDDVLEIAGSESALQDKAIELLLSSIDYNPLHVTSKKHTKQDQQKILVAMAGM